MPRRLKQRFDRVMAHPVAQNSLALYGVEFTNYILPLVTVPYLARVLRPHGWGLVVFAQAFSLWISLVIEYGFNLSATREIARCRDDAARIANVVAAVVWARIPLVFLSLALALLAAKTVPVFVERPDYLMWAWLYAVAQGLSPLWYFQGLERMRLPAILHISSRVLAAGSILFFVRTPADGWKVLAAQAIAGLISTSVAYIWLRSEVRLSPPPIREVVRVMRMGWNIFVCCSATNVHASVNTLILGLCGSPTAIAMYGGSMKLKSAMSGHLWPLWKAIYPRMSYLVKHDREQAEQTSRRVLLALCGIAVMSTVIVELTAPLLVRLLLGSGYGAATPILRVMALTTLPITVNGLAGIQWILPLGMDRVYNGITIVIAGLSVGLAIIVAPVYGAMGLAVIMLFCESATAVCMCYVVRRLRLKPASQVATSEPEPRLMAEVSA